MAASGFCSSSCSCWRSLAGGDRSGSGISRDSLGTVTTMPDKKTIRRARKDKREGKSAGTQAGEFVRETIEHIRERKHGARSAKQAIAIGLSKARRAGVKLPVPAKGKVSEKTRKQAVRDSSKAKKGGPSKPSPKRARASVRALRREGTSAASSRALSRQSRASAAKRSTTNRSAAARKASRTKGAAGRSSAARKAARTRSKRS